MKPSAIFTKKIMGIDLRVWQTMFITILALTLLGVVKFILNSTCSDLNILVNNHDVSASRYLYANKPILFKVDTKDTGTKVVWKFTQNKQSEEEKGNPVTHIFKEPGDYTVEAIVNKKCKLSITVRLQQALTSDNLGSSSSGGNPINGLDLAKTAQAISFFCDITATTYTWKVLEDAGIPQGTSNIYNPVFLNPGIYTIQLLLNNDSMKLYTKKVVVSAPVDMPNTILPGNGAGGPAPVAPVSPNVAPPMNMPQNNTPDAAEEEEKTTKVDEVKKKKVPLYIPDQELQYQLTQIGDKKASILDLKEYFCEGYESNTKVQLDGKIITITELCNKLQGKKGLMGMGGKPKIKSLKTSRDPDTKCIVVIYIDLK